MVSQVSSSEVMPFSLLIFAAALGVIEIRSRACEVNGDEVEIRARFSGSDEREYEYVFGGGEDSGWGYINHDWLHAGMFSERPPLQLRSQRLVDEALDFVQHEVQTEGSFELFGMPLLALILTPGALPTFKGRQLIADCLPQVNGVTFRDVSVLETDAHLMRLTERELEDFLANGFELCFAEDAEFSATVLAPMISLLPYPLTRLRERFATLDHVDALALSQLNRDTRAEVLRLIAALGPREGVLWGELRVLESHSKVNTPVGKGTDPFPDTRTEQFPNITGLFALCEEVLANPVLEGTSDTLQALLGFHRLGMLQVSVERGLCLMSAALLSEVVEWEAGCILRSSNLEDSPPLPSEVEEAVLWVRDSWQITRT